MNSLGFLDFFIYTGNIDALLRIGENINKCIKYDFYKITEQDIDIPAIYEVYIKKKRLEISCLNNIIVGISFKFDENNSHSIRFLNKFSYDSDLASFIDYLNSKRDLFWEIDNIDSGEKTLVLKINNKTKILYSFHDKPFVFCQIVYFNITLYKQLCQYQ